jgi:PAS domain S-box-containing protein
MYLRRPDADSDSERRTDRVPELAGFALFAVGYWLAYRFGMRFSDVAASPFWFPDSALLCALIATPARRWWLYIAITLPIRLFSSVAAEVPLWFLFATFLIDSLKGVSIALALRRFLRVPFRFEMVRDLAIYALFALLAVPMLGAVAGATARGFRGFDFAESWVQWYLGNALTHLVVTPAVFCWILDRRPPRRELGFRGAEVAALAAGLGGACWYAFRVEDFTVASPLLYLPAPFLLWAAIRFGMRGATAGALLFAAFAVRAAFEGAGPFATRTPQELAFLLQAYLAPRIATYLFVAVLVQQELRSRAQARESEIAFRAMADTTPVLIWLTDLAGRITFVNQSWVDFTASTREAQVGTSWTERVDAEERERCHELEAACRAAGRQEIFDCRFVRSDGVTRWFHVTLVPRRSATGELLGTLGTGVDITAARQAELDKRHSLEELAHASRVATIGAFSTSITHELRQPLTAILANAEAAAMLLSRADVPLATLREIVDDIRNDDERAGQIVAQMRELLRKKHELVREPIELDALVRETCHLLRVEASHRGIEVRLELARPLPRVLGDRVHLRQVVMNLLLNAFEAMTDQAGRPRDVVVRLLAGPDRSVRLEVADRGPGIAPEEADRLFEPFWTTKSRGLGMGLPISRTIVEAHGGRIRAETAIGEGALFVVDLPAADEARDPALPLA